MQTNRVIVLYPQTTQESRTLPRPQRHVLETLRLFTAAVELFVTAAIGVGVLICFGLVFTML